MRRALYAGKLDVIRWLREECEPHCPVEFDDVMIAIIEKGQTHMAPYFANAQNLKWVSSKSTSSKSAMQNTIASCLEAAIKKGSMDMLHALQVLCKSWGANFNYWEPCITAAARTGRLDILQWVIMHMDREAGEVDGKIVWGHHLVGHPMRGNHFYGTMHAAMQGGQLAVVQWLRHPDREARDAEGKLIWGGRCPWNGASDCTTVVIPWTNDTATIIRMLAWVRHPDREALDADGNSIWGGRCPWDARVCAEAAHRNDLVLLKWLRHPDREKDAGGRCPWNSDTCGAAAAKGYIHILEWLRHSDRDYVQRDGECVGGGRCPWNVYTYLKGCEAAKQWMIHPDRERDAGGRCPSR